MSTASSAPHARTGCGYRTSPMSLPGAASFTWLLSSTPSPGALSAGGPAAPLRAFPPALRTGGTFGPSPMPGSSSMLLSGLVHHSDRGVQYVSIKYTERLADAGIEPSVGSVGDSYDNALAETINGLYKAELIHRRGPWRSFEAVERGGRVCLNTVSLSISGSSAGLVGSMPASWPRARRA